MKDSYLFYDDNGDVVSVNKDEILTSLFCQELIIKGISIHDWDNVRCTATTLVNEIHRYLIDKYGLDS